MARLSFMQLVMIGSEVSLGGEKKATRLDMEWRSAETRSHDLARARELAYRQIP